MKIKLSDYVIKFLEKTSSEYVFMLPGGGAMHLNDSLGKSEKIKFVCCQNEQGAAIAAEAYARVNGDVGLLMVTTGPGGTNALTGVAAAYVESTPILIISGQVKRLDMIRDQNIRQQGMQELDIVSIVKPITKYAVCVEQPNLIRYHLEKAFFEATNGRKGPVWVDIPLDVQATFIDEESLVGYEPLKVPEINLNKVSLKVIECINKSKRPVLLAGNGIRLSGAKNQFHKLIKELNIPVLTTWNGIDLISDDNQLFYGRPGGLGQRYANFIQQNADLLICIGARLNLLQTGYNFDGFAREATKIVVDIDRNELFKINVRPDIPICADAGRFIESILNNKKQIQKINRKEWLDYCKRVKNNYPIVKKEYWAQDEKVNTYCLIDTLSQQMEMDDIYVSGSSGSCIDISMQTFKVKNGQRVFCTKGLASMGYGLPSTIGACLAGRGRRVVSVNGDGGFVMNIQELETIRRLNLQIKIFVLCNNGYGAIQATQTNIFNKHFVACNDSSGLSIPDIEAIANAYKIHTIHIKTNKELAGKVKEALDYSGPVVIKVDTPIDLTALPKQVSYKRKDGQMESKPLEFMNPELDSEEMKKNMLIAPYEEQ